MLEQELENELDRYLLLHYRPDGTVVKNFEDESKDFTKTPVAGLTGMVLCQDLKQTKMRIFL